MNVSFNQCSLYLCPKQADFVVNDSSVFIHGLQEINFIKNKIKTPETNNHYFSGEKFLDYIAYMGCAPNIQFEASENNTNFCFIKLHFFENAQLIFSRVQTKAPHCPRCKKQIKNWQETKTPTTIHCQQCNSTINNKDLNWRKMAGYAQLFIEVTNIFPKEAIPQQMLLDKLAVISNTEWEYFYSCQ